jgi:hypothetical protein
MARALSIVFLTALLLVPTWALGQDAGPAVSDPNGKFSVEGGAYDDEQSALALGSYTLPLGHAFGLQADGAVGHIDQDTMGGGGVHLFTRDPSRYLLGAYGSYHTWNDINIWRAAAEFQLYVDRFSLDGLAGYEGINFPSTAGGLPVLSSDDNHAFTHIDLAYYPIDDLRLYAGYRYESEASLGAAGFEYLLRNYGSPMSLFVKSDFGKEEFNRVTGGLRIYLGPNPDKTLIARHRTEDPENYTPVFPTVRTQSAALPQCATDGDNVTTTNNGQCLCPASSPRAGNLPTPLGGGAFSCS